MIIDSFKHYRLSVDISEDMLKSVYQNLMAYGNLSLNYPLLKAQPTLYSRPRLANEGLTNT